MYDFNNILAWYSLVWKQFSKSTKYDVMPTGLSLVVSSWFLYLVICSIGFVLYKVGIVPHELDYSFLFDIQWEYTTCALLFYPITFTVIYTPIALLLAIPVVLYKHVFKLG